VETRSVPFELRASADGRTMSGYAAVFGSPTRIFERNREFMESVARGAFSRTIAAKDRVVLMFDHGQHPLIGGMPLGKITDMREDDHGLWIEARLSDHFLADIVGTAIADEAITGMSFRFSVPDGGDVWDRTGDMPTRTINEVKLYELGPVTMPAYDTTSVGVRSVLDLLSDDQRHAVIDPLLPTPDDGSAEPATPVTPDEGSRSRNQRQALLRLHNVQKGHSR
jgi:HK97 family phage prohead protease